MFRETFADLNMYFYLIVLSLFYSVNSLPVSTINDSTTESLSILNKTTSVPVTPQLPEVYQYEDRFLTNSTTERPTAVTEKEAKPDFNKNVLQLLNKPPGNY